MLTGIPIGYVAVFVASEKSNAEQLSLHGFLRQISAAPPNPTDNAMGQFDQPGQCQ